MFAVVRGVTVPQDVMGHAFGDAGGFGECEDGGSEIANVGGGAPATLAVIGSFVTPWEQPPRVGVLVL